MDISSFMYCLLTKLERRTCQHLKSKRSCLQSDVVRLLHLCTTIDVKSRINLYGISKDKAETFLYGSAVHHLTADTWTAAPVRQNLDTCLPMMLQDLRSEQGNRAPNVISAKVPVLVPTAGCAGGDTDGWASFKLHVAEALQWTSWSCCSSSHS
jgi:hypothetical protein